MNQKNFVSPSHLLFQKHHSDSSLPLPFFSTSSKQGRKNILRESDPAKAICLAARQGNIKFIKEHADMLLILDENGDSVITHAVDSGNMLSLNFLLHYPSYVEKLLNRPSKFGNYPLMNAVLNNNVDCVEALLAVGARIMVPVNDFESGNVTPTSMLHEIIYTQAYPDGSTQKMEEEDLFNEQMGYTTSSQITGRILTMILDHLIHNSGNMYSWADQVSILLFRTIIGKDTKSAKMRTPLELANDLHMRNTARQLAEVQRALCMTLFQKTNPNQINFPLQFLHCEVFGAHSALSLHHSLLNPQHLDASRYIPAPQERYYAFCLKSLCDLSPEKKYLKDALVYLEQEQNATGSPSNPLIEKMKRVIQRGLKEHY